MKSLAEVKQKFSRAKYPPLEGCKNCGGTGELIKHPGMPCICVFVAHDVVGIAADCLSTVAKRELAKLR